MANLKSLLMNVEGAVKHIECVKAYAEGKQIQYKAPHSIVWEDIDEPAFYCNFEYRVKPEPMVIYINVYPENPHHHSRFGTIYTDRDTAIIARHKDGKTRKFVEVLD